ncbi:energy-coupling factor transporter transmembrane component T family protein [Caldalkalibacillus salinus]|uniref:energy-coupling factor transporter transmembrane component T family protein n=1 Tax=Caldalkalibacillus salinus TaxID=2803787 RepID=UPI001924A038|nr:energy-coupling factor transporter transmembrane component T [Caldalkalibacillus salinus]
MSIDLSYQETWMHKANPSLKLVLFLILMVTLLFIHRLDYLIYFTVFPLALLFLFTGHPIKRVLLFSIPFVLLFISTSTSMIFFGKGDTTWFHWGLVHITEESFYRGIHLGFRALNYAIIGLVFALTTRPVNLFYSLMQQMKLAPRYAYSFMAAVRLLPIAFEEFQTLRYAYKVRGVQHEKGLKGMYEKLKFYAIPLLAQSIRRAQRIALAMEAKQFTNGRRTHYYRIGFSRHDLTLVLCVMMSILSAYLFSQYLPYTGVEDVRYYD